MVFIEQFDVILLDLNGTFMFEHDRFGSEQDFYATYRAHGGDRLDGATVTALMARCFNELYRAYDDPAYFDDFPTLVEAFTQFTDADAVDLPALCATFAAHEIGRVPPAHAALLQHLSSTHRLGVVSNIFSEPSTWRTYFSDIGLASVFTSTVFASDGRSIKPSSRIFHRAFADFPDAQRILFIGDSWERDMMPAKQLGCATVWISAAGAGDVDCVIPSLLALPRVTV